MGGHDHRAVVRTCVGVLALLLAPPLLPCSTIASDAEFWLGADGLVHWSRGWDPTNADRPFGYDFFDLTASSAELTLRPVAAPSSLGYSSGIVGRTATDQTWWNISCARSDARQICNRLVLTSAVGTVLGWVASHPLDDLWFDGDRLHALATQPDRGSYYRRSDPQAPHTVTLLSAKPRSLEETRVVPTDGAVILDGWEVAWSTTLDLPERSWNDRLRIIVRERIIGFVHKDDETVTVGVFDAPSATSTDAAAALRYRRTFPRARHGLATTNSGEVALAMPLSLALSSDGRLALSNWTYHSDCSHDRSPGFVIFSPEGQVTADVQTEWRTFNVAFDAAEHLAVDRSGRIELYTATGELVEAAPSHPPKWDKLYEEQAERARALTAASPIAEWAEFYNFLESKQVAADLLVREWPRAEPLLQDDPWLDLGALFCAEHGSAARTAALTRFDGAVGPGKLAWLWVIGQCFQEGPPSAMAFARELLEIEGMSDDRQLQPLLERWLPREAAGDSTVSTDAWQQAVAARASADRKIWAGARAARAHLLADFDNQREALASHLQTGRARGETARAILLEALSVQAQPFGDRSVVNLRPALEAAADAWQDAETESLRTTGDILRLATTGSIDPVRGVELLQLAKSLGDLQLLTALALAIAIRSPNTSTALFFDDFDYSGVETSGIPRERVLEFLRVLAPHPGSGDPFLSRSVRSAASNARVAIARSLQADGRDFLFDQLVAANTAEERRDAFNPVVFWMMDAPGDWSVKQLGTLISGLHFSGRSGEPAVHLLNSVSFEFDAAHPLGQLVRRRFRDLIDQTIRAKSGQSDETDQSPNRPPWFLDQLFGSGPKEEDSPLYAVLQAEDLRALLGAEEDLVPWLAVLSKTGPWPAIEPQLERLLQSNASLMAAVVLSWTQNERAREVLLTLRQAESVYHRSPELLEGLRRFGLLSKSDG